MAVPTAVYVIGITSLLVACVGADQFAKFGYTGSLSPDNWGSLSPDYHECSGGNHQSPINIVTRDAVASPHLKPLERDYNPANATLIDNGFNIMLRYVEDAGAIAIDGKNYSLVQMHWHLPSEHTIDGVRYPVELHLVHVSDDGNYAVVAILYQYGHPDPFLYQLKEEVDELSREACAGNEEAHVPVGIVQTKALNRHTRKYFRYVGSLTTPPCTENVIWNILGKVRVISKEQAAALRAPMNSECKNNSRPTQPLNGRQVLVYHEGEDVLKTTTTTT